MLESVQQNSLPGRHFEKLMHQLLEIAKSCFDLFK